MPPDPAGWPRIVAPDGYPTAAVEARKRAAFAAADVALAASGTVSLELAAQGAPMVIGYKVHPLTAPFARRLLRIDTSTLVNLVTDTRAVPEFFQEACTPDNLAAAVGAPARRPGRRSRAARRRGARR